jgi:hypothetical protein
LFFTHSLIGILFIDYTSVLFSPVQRIARFFMPDSVMSTDNRQSFTGFAVVVVTANARQAENPLRGKGFSSITYFALPEFKPINGRGYSPFGLRARAYCPHTSRIIYYKRKCKSRVIDRLINGRGG